MTASNSKFRLREEYLRKRRALSPDVAGSLSLAVEERFLSLPEFMAASRLALYSSYDNEVNTGEIFSVAVAAGKEVFFPKADKERHHLSFFKVCDGDGLNPGLFNINEPVGTEFCEKGGVSSFDLVVVPGVAFDLKGARIGFGKGFYDRVLESTKAAIVGLSYELQLTEEAIPVEPHDVSINILVTEDRILRF